MSAGQFSTFLGGRAARFMVKLVDMVFTICLLLTFASFFFAKTTSRDVLSGRRPNRLVRATGRMGGCTKTHNTRLTRFLVGRYFNLTTCFVVLFLTMINVGLVGTCRFHV